MTEIYQWPPEPWAIQLTKLSNDTHAYLSNISNISSGISSLLGANLAIRSLPEVTRLEEQLAFGATTAASMVSGLDTFSALASRPESIFGNFTRIPNPSLELAIGSSGSVLKSAASMASTLRSAADNFSLVIPNTLSTIIQSQPHQLLSTGLPVGEYPIGENLVNLGIAFSENITSLNKLLDTSFATAHLSSQVFTSPGIGIPPYLTQASEAFTLLNNLSSDIYREYHALSIIPANDLLFRAPTMEPYAAIQAMGLVLGVPDQDLVDLQEENAEEFFDELDSDFQYRLEAFSPRLADIYREGLAAIKSKHRGWIRHAGVSFRTMFIQLLRDLAPDDVLNTYYENPQQEMKDGEFTRDAQLRYIFRNIATGSYAKMAEQDIKLAEAIFFPVNNVVHNPNIELTEPQMKILWRRIQGSASVILEASGH
jgi:hypothetical protein